MFYQENEINEIIKCPCCKIRYNDPRLLPCSLSMCFSCIQLLTNSEANTLKCVCNNIHSIPSDGFLQNAGLARLAEKVPNEVFRSEEVEQLKTNLSEIKQKFDSLKSDMNIGKDKITEYCNSVKNEIQLKTETRIEAIKQDSFKILQQVDDFERDCLLNYDDSLSGNNQFVQDFMYVENFYNKWTSYLSSFSIMENVVAEANIACKKLLVILNKTNLKYLNKLMGGNLIKFVECNREFKSEFIGYVIYESLNLSNAINQISNRKNIVKCSSHLRNPIEKCEINAKNLDENEVLAVMEITDYKVLNIFMVDYDGNLIKRINISNPNSTAEIKYASMEKLSKPDNFELIYIFTCYRLKKDENKYIAQVYDQNLKLKVIKQIKFTSNSLFIYLNRIYCLVNSKQDYKFLFEYDEGLNLVKQYGQSKKELPFYFSSNIKKVLVNDNFFILLERDADSDFNIIIMDKMNGNVVKSFETDSKLDCISLYMDRYILNHSKKPDKKYNVYSFDLKYLDYIEKTRTKYRIDSGESSLNLVDVFGFNLICFDSSKKYFYF